MVITLDHSSEAPTQCKKKGPNKHIDIWYHYVRDAIEDDKIKPYHIDGARNCEGDQSRALQEIPQLNCAIKYVTTHLQEIPQRIR